MKNYTCLIIALLIFTSCQKGELKAPESAKSCKQTLQHDIVSVSGPTTAIVNQNITFNVSWKGLNSCDAFVAFKQDTVGNTITVGTFAAHDSCQVCNTPNDLYKTSAYQFKANAPGTYYLQFFKTGNSSSTAITDTIVVK